ncbi:hypothetical protein KBX29_00980 [Corynebacterium sp. CCUG 18816]|uniref:hypothetical protein n=1 Tax=Corynebacterium pseudogenitalium TaxID=38303 RepID=UPI00210BA651|nr:hypothetical protein [Corynebacterium pseudogenitalium]MCQ4615415.1 hypothetical protein [Corynebacterium pseudogenitalium]
MSTIDQAKMISTRADMAGAPLAPRSSMPAEVWDFVPMRGDRGSKPSRHEQVINQNFRCHWAAADAPEPTVYSSAEPQEQRANVLMGALLGVTMFVAVLISGDFGNSEWDSVSRDDSNVAHSYEVASAAQR